MHSTTLRASIGLLFCAPAALAAQTLYYVDSISISPSAPTTSDPIVITLHGNLNMSNAAIVSTGHSLLGNNVFLTLSADTLGSGVPALVPQNVDFAIGTLPGGSYSINVSGNLIFDSAPAPQHLFSVSGGGGWICDSLTLTFMEYSPVSDDLIWVLLENTSTGQVNDQCVYLLDQNGDTLAGQTEFAFPIVPGTTGFYLEVFPGVSLPDGPLQGTLAISSGSCSVQQCALGWNADLCPEEPCTNMLVAIEPTPAATYPLTVAWQVLQDGQSSVATGSLLLTGPAWVASDTLCLEPGNYSVITDPLNAPDSAVIAYAVVGQFGGIATSWNVNDGSPEVLTFTLYGACEDSALSIGSPTPAHALSVACSDDVLQVTVPAGGQNGMLMLYTMDGRVLKQVTAESDRVGVPVADLATGVYLLQYVPTGVAARVFVD